MPYPLPDSCAVNTVPIVEEILWGFVSGECLHHVLSRPLRGGKLSDIGMHDPSPFMRQDHQAESTLYVAVGTAEKSMATKSLTRLYRNIFQVGVLRP